MRREGARPFAAKDPVYVAPQLGGTGDGTSAHGRLARDHMRALVAPIHRWLDQIEAREAKQRSD